MATGTNLPAISVYNSRVVLQAIRDHAPVSRSGLAALTGLTNATMTNIVRKLIGEGLVVEAGHGASVRGKPQVFLELRADARFAVGVLVDTDSLHFVLTDLSGQIVEQHTTEGAGMREPLEVVAEIAVEIERLIVRADVERADVIGVGVAMPGPVDAVRGVVLTPPFLPRWHSFPIVERLEELLRLPVLLANDANATALGEHWLTDAHDKQNFACIYMGDGIGTGMFLDGHVFAGTSQNAGEIAHVSMDARGPVCWCGNRGCLENYASPTAIVASARERLGARAPADYASLRMLASQGDEDALAVVRDAAMYLSVAAVTVSVLLDLQLIVLAGKGFHGVEGVFVDAVQDALADRTRTGHAPRATVRMSLVGDVAGAVGAATLLLDDALSPTLSGARVSSPSAPPGETELLAR